MSINSALMLCRVFDLISLKLPVGIIFSYPTEPISPEKRTRISRLEHTSLHELQLPTTVFVYHVYDRAPTRRKVSTYIYLNKHVKWVQIVIYLLTIGL